MTPMGGEPRWLLALVGPPGSGKGTQAAWLASALGLEVLSSGDLVRKAAQECTDRGRIVKSSMVEGALVPDSILFELLREAIADTASASRGLLFDGFPRTTAQAEALEEAFLVRPVDAYIELHVDDDVLLDRLAGRGRADDHELAVLRRLDEFDLHTRPMIERLRAQGRVLTVDGAQPPAWVHRAITDALGRHHRRHQEAPSCA
jgi:adenylate kinase